MRKTQDSTKGQIFACRKETGVMSSSKSRSSRRRDRDYSSRSPSPQRRRRRRRRSRSSSTEISRSRRHSRSDSDTRKKSYRKYSPSDSSEDSDRCHRRDNSSKHGRHRRGNSSGHSRRRRERRRSRSRSRSAHREHKRRRERSHSTERRRQRRERSGSDERRGKSSKEKTESKEPSKEKSDEVSADAKKVNAAENLKAKVKALLAKSSEGTSEMKPDSYDNNVIMPTPGQLLLIESNSFTADKFISKRSSKKWDVPPSQVAQKKASISKSSYDATTVDPSEFVPKVVPMCEVESALGREGNGGVMVADEEGGRDVVLIKQNTDDSTPDAEPKDKNQKWLQKLKKMRQKFAELPTD